MHALCIIIIYETCLNVLLQFLVAPNTHTVCRSNGSLLRLCVDVLSYNLCELGGSEMQGGKIGSQNGLFSYVPPLICE